MTIYEKLVAKNLISPDGLVTLVGQPNGCDNGALFTTQAIKLIQRLEPDSKQRDIDLLNLYLALDELIDEKGLTHRRPNDNEQDSPDNTIALCSTDAPVALRIYNYGRSTLSLFPPCPRFVYNTENPGKFTFRSWLGRQPGLIGYMQIKSNVWVNPIRYLILCGGLYLTSELPLEKTSDRLLGQLIIDSMPVRWYTKPIISWWNKKIKKQYTNGINDVVRTYFGSGHVFTEIWK